MATPRIKSTAVLIGYCPDGNCVYSEILSMLDYYESKHVWDQQAKVKRLRLHKIKGFLFAANGELDQEFESTFNIATGEFISGRVRYSDGTENQFPSA